MRTFRATIEGVADWADYRRNRRGSRPCPRATYDVSVRELPDVADQDFETSVRISAGARYGQDHRPTRITHFSFIEIANPDDSAEGG